MCCVGESDVIMMKVQVVVQMSIYIVCFVIRGNETKRKSVVLPTLFILCGGRGACRSDTKANAQDQKWVSRMEGDKVDKVDKGS